MSHSVCNRWTELSDRMALNEALSDEEQRFIRRHPTQCAACAAEGRVWEELGELLPRDNAAPRVQQPTASHPHQPRPNRRSFRALIVSSTAAAVAAAIVLGIAGIWEVRGKGDGDQAVFPVEASVTIASFSGKATVDGRPITVGLRVSSQQVITVGSGRLCLAYSPGVTACAAPGSVLRAVSRHREQHLMLDRGAVVCQLDARPPEGEFSVITARGKVTAKGTVFAVELQDDSVLRDDAKLAVRLHRGIVEVEAPSGERRELHAPAAVVVDSGFRAAPSAGTDWQTDLWTLESSGLSSLTALPQQPLPSRDAPPAPQPETVPKAGPNLSPVVSGGDTSPKAQPARPSAEQLLSRAAKLRAAKRFAEAGVVYQTLVREHQRSSAGRAALISLAELQLSRLGQPESALRSFDAYLAQGGPLAQEARYGRIRALRRLGRNEQARDATKLFLRDYPGSPQAAAIRGTAEDG